MLNRGSIGSADHLRRLLAPAVLFVLVMLIAPWLGGERVTWADAASRFSGHPTVGGWVFWKLRVPRVAMAATAGIALAVAGCVFQSTFRNPLADPYTLGVASGAAVGAALALRMGWTRAVGGISTVTAAAFVGATVSLVLVYGVAGAWRRVAAEALLLAGISIAFICSAIVLLIEYLSIGPVTNLTIQWLMGSLGGVGSQRVAAALPWVIAGLGVVWYLRRDLDLFMMGEPVAAGRGVSVVRARTAAYFAASLMTAAVVAQCGPIAFVGLVVPHVVRAWCGPAHGVLVPAAALCGGAFLVMCDVVAAHGLHWVAGSAQQIPVGVMTNLIGGVFFLHLLLSRRGES